MGVGETIAGRYMTDAIVAAGASATVYVAHSVMTQGRVALKVLHEQHRDREDLVERFEREAKALRKFFHDNIVAYYDHGQDDKGRPFLVMEYLEGWPGGDLIGSTLSHAQKVDLLGQVCSAVQYANDRGIIHRDLKWTNIIVTTPPGSHDMVLKVIDFGVIKQLHTMGGKRLTTAGAVMGSPHTVSPEQVRDKPLDSRSDVYSIGCMAYELFTAKKPFDGKSAQLICISHLRDTPPQPHEVASDVPATVSAVIMKAIEKNPDNRFSGPMAFHRALSAVLG